MRLPWLRPLGTISGRRVALMTRTLGHFFFSAGLVMATACPACFGQACTEREFERMAGSEGIRGEQGRAVALSADGATALVGADYDADGLGAAYFFGRVGNAWVQLGPKVVPAVTFGLRAFGISVALDDSGTIALIGAGPGSLASQGVHVYTRSGDVWNEAGPGPVPPLSNSFTDFGYSLALSGDGNTAVVGAPHDNNYIGAAYVFVRTGTTWTQQGPGITLNWSGAGYPLFGISVAISRDGNIALIGDYSENGGMGGAHVFSRSGDTWSQDGLGLVPIDLATPAAGAAFGLTLALSGDGETALVGALYDNWSSGAAFAFARLNGIWTQQGPKFVSSAGTGYHAFANGLSLSQDGNTALVGGGAVGSAGAVYVYSRTDGAWNRSSHQIVPNDDPATGFGFSIAFSRDTNGVLIGSPGDFSGVGAAYFVPSLPCYCYANCDHSTTPPILNALDFLCFIDRYSTGDGYANCDLSGATPAFNVNDFQCFINNFAAGCP